jgi:hypothetical protein
MKPELHPACAQWPKMTKSELAELAKDIEQNGQLEPITLLPDGRLLDGSNRWDACELINKLPHTIIYEGDDPIGYVLSRNKHRRHMALGALALITAELVKLKRGEKPNPYDVRICSTAEKTTEQLAENAGLSVSIVEKARAVLKNGAPNVIESVKKGEVPVTTAADAVQGRSKEEQAGWSAKDVKRIGVQVRDARPYIQKRKVVSKSIDHVKPTIAPIKFPTAEETGFPVNGSIAEQHAHHRKYGRTPLHAKEVKDMINHEAAVSTYVAAIVTATNNSHPNAKALLDSLDAMSAWVPQPEKGKDWAVNFAAKAKKHLALIRERLPILVERATELQTALAQRVQ